jgi:hypothetical protein
MACIPRIDDPQILNTRHDKKKTQPPIAHTVAGRLALERPATSLHLFPETITEPLGGGIYREALTSNRLGYYDRRIPLQPVLFGFRHGRQFLCGPWRRAAGGRSWVASGWLVAFAGIGAEVFSELVGHATLGSTGTTRQRARS